MVVGYCPNKEGDEVRTKDDESKNSIISLLTTDTFSILQH